MTDISTAPVQSSRKFGVRDLMVGTGIFAASVILAIGPVVLAEQTISDEEAQQHVMDALEIEAERDRIRNMAGGVILIGAGCGAEKVTIVAQDEDDWMTWGCETIEVAPYFTE